MVSEPGYPWRKSRAMGIKNPKFLPVLAADRPSSFSGYGGAPADRPYSFSSYGGAPVDRPYSFSGYGGGPNRSVVKVPDIVPGKIPNPAPISGKITKSMVRYEAVASDPTAVWRIASATNYKTDMVQHKRGDFQKVMAGMHESLNRIEELVQKLVSSQTRDLPDLVPPAEWENEKTRRSEDLKLISLNSTQGTQLRNTSKGNFNVPSTGFSVDATGWGRDPLPNPPLASPTLNPSHGPELEKPCPQLNVTGVLWDDNMSLDNESDQDDDFPDTEVPPSEAYRVKDLDVLKVETPTDLLKPINVGLSSALRVGQQCLAIENPLGFNHPLTVGIISGLNRDIFSKAGVTIEDGAHFLMKQGAVLYNLEAHMLPKNHHCYFIRLMLEYFKFSSFDSYEFSACKSNNPKHSQLAEFNPLQFNAVYCSEGYNSYAVVSFTKDWIGFKNTLAFQNYWKSKCLGMLKAMRSHHEYNYVAYRKAIGVVCNKKGGFGVDDRWLWSIGLLWNLPPWPDLSLCEADWMAIDIEKGTAEMCLRMAAMFGGIVGQEVVQACSGKFHPVYQFFYIDSVESLPVEPLESGDLKPENTRYTTQISVVGSKLRKKLEQAKIFTDGSGALGGEVLKNMALMGISCSPDGKLTVTDDDVIEQSNFSRQFLVHDWNSGQTKSTVAATVVMAINSKNYVEAQMLPKSHYCYLIRLTLEYCKFSSLDADEITKESRRRLSNSFGKIRYCLNDVGLLGASEAIRISIEKGQKKGWLKGASDATYQESDAHGLCLFAEISALHMKFFEEVLHLIVKRLQQEMEHLSYYTVPCLTGGSSSIDVLEVVGQNYSDFVLNITSKKLKPGVPSDKNPQDVTSGTNNSDSQKCNSEQIYSANGVASQNINSTDEHIGDCKVESSVFPLSSEDTISETRYPADNWNSCQFALSNGSPVHNNQSVPQSGLSYGDNDLSYIDWPGIDNFEEDDTLFRCDSTYGQQQLENTEELSLILSSSDAIYSSDVALQPGFEPSYSDYGILDDLSAFNGTHDKLYTVATGLKVPILDPNYVPGQKKDLFEKSVQHTVIWMGKKQESVEDVPCGNTFVMVGLDQLITKNATWTNEKEFDACLIRTMTFSVFLVVRVTVQCKVAPDLPKLAESLKRLAKPNLMVICTMEDSDEYNIAGVEDFHLEICLKNLLKKLLGRMLAAGSSHLLCSSLVCPWMILLLQLYCWINAFNHLPLFFSQKSIFKKYSQNFMPRLTNPGFLIKYLRTSIILRRRECQNLKNCFWEIAVYF